MTFTQIYYGGNGTTPVDSGMPRVGQMYGVDPNGDLRWYQYSGTGQSDPTGSGLGWNSNSRNVIGVGWNSFRKIVTLGDGVMMGVEPGGNLRWYQYNGNGESDPTGSGLNWDPNSRNVIGVGWQSFRFLCSKPYEGRTSTHSNNSALYGVEPGGNLRWYRYLGNGENDPSGSGLGWHPNSRNVIGVGWSAGIHYMAAISDIILLVQDDGALRWYRYGGNGENDPTGGGLGWHPNSGNFIGKGWQGFRHIFGGSDGAGGYVIYGVEQNGNLRWYRYAGSGENDPAGSSSRWHPNSGHVIGVGW